MIVWLNGTFGVGKTHTAYELAKRLEHAFVYDPERVGYWLRASQPKQLWLPNFQDEPLWRTINLKMLCQLDHEYDGTIVVPMTVAQPRYYEELIGGLRREGVDVYHFVLSANERTIRRRLHRRLEGRHSWAYQHYSHCSRALALPPFEGHIATDSLTICQTAEYIADALSLPLLPRSPALLRPFIRLARTVRSIR